jgi:hypothetical protein
MVELVSAGEAIGGASTLGTETLITAEAAEALSGLGLAGEVAAGVLSAEVLIPALGVGLAIKEIYDIASDIF